ncbi:MAG: hypothetical protein WA659_05570 [Candidatus Aquirickettsiella sp.]
MSNDIELLKQDFLTYLTFLVFPSSKILIDKIPSAFQETKLNKIEIYADNRKILFKEHEDKECYLTNESLGKFGLSVENFRNSIVAIKKEKTSKTLSEGIEELLDSYTKKLCEIYIPQAILAYTNLYEKFKSENYKATDDKTHDSIAEDLKKQNPTQEILSTYGIFSKAYQGQNLGFATIFGPSNEYLIFKLVQKLKENFCPYEKTYTTLISKIEKLHMCAENKNTTNTLITQLKQLTDSCFLSLIKASLYEKDKKLKYEATIEEFKSTTQKLIKSYIEDYPDEYKKQCSILEKILWFISKIIPSSILPEDRKMTLFYTPNGIRVKKLNDQIKTLTQQHFVY